MLWLGLFPMRDVSSQVLSFWLTCFYSQPIENNSVHTVWPNHSKNHGFPTPTGEVSKSLLPILQVLTIPPAIYTDEIYRRRNFYFALWKEEVLENLFMCMMCFTVGQLIPFAVKPVRCLHSTSCILTCLFRTGNHVQFNFNFLYNFQLTGILCSLSANTLCVTVLKQFLYHRMLLLTIQGISLNSRY